VPLTWPLDESVNPGGSDPPMKLYWYGSAGPHPPAPVNVKLYGDPTVPTGAK